MSNLHLGRSLLCCFALIASSSTCAPAQDQPKAETPIKNIVTEALTAYRSGKYSEAVEKYTQAIVADPKSGDAYAGLVRVYLKQEQVEKADEAVKRGLAACPNCNSVQTALGEVYFRQGKMAEADQQFVKVINTGDLDARAYLGLAKIRTAISMHKKAKGLLMRAHAFDPDDPDIQRYWMSTLKRSERIKALEFFLAASNNEDKEEQESSSRYLELLKYREKNPGGGCKIVSKLASTETPLVRIMDGPKYIHGYGLIVKFSNQNARLLLDTGASGLTVKKSIAEKAGIKKIIATTIGGIGDQKDTDAYIGFAESITVGKLTFQNCLVDVTEKSLDANMDGLIGADVFSDYLVGIDFTAEKLKLSELPKRPNDISAPASLKTEGDNDEEEQQDTLQDRYIAPEMQNYTKVFRFGHNLLVPTKVGDSGWKLFMIDTGSMTNGISPAAAREVTKIHTEGSIELRGLGGRVNKVFTADKAVIEFSRYRQENQEMISWDFSRISKSLGVEVSGFLGFTTLRMFELKIDYRDGLVDFNFNNKLMYGR